MEVTIPGEVGEALKSSELQVLVEANSYRTRRIIPLEIDDQIQDWHSVKGGLNTQPDKVRDPNKLNVVSFEVLFNPQTRSWLKIVPPEATNKKPLEERLRKGAGIAQTALLVAHLPQLAQQVRGLQLETENQLTSSKEVVYGFLSPHIGPSLEYLYKLLGQNLSPEVADFFERVYSIAFHQASRLYLDYGYWVADPNLGNILLHQTPDGLAVVLIDFANKKQIMEHRFSEIPDQLSDRRQKLREKILARLAGRFEKEYQRLHLFFNP